MTNQQFNAQFTRLREAFPGQQPPAKPDEYFDLLSDMSATSFGRVIDRVLKEHSTIPYPSIS